MNWINSGGALRYVGLWLLVSLAGTAGAAAQESRVCSVRAIEGAPARMESAGGWAELAVGPLPGAARRIATGPGARVEIACDDGLVLTLGAGIDVALDRLTGAAGPSESVVLRLLRGVIGIDAPNRTWRSFEVRTPLAIASARSTEWLVEFGEATGAAVFVRAGSVEVAAPRGGAAAVLDAGEGVTILPGATSAAVIRWGEGRRAGAAATLGFGWR